MNCWRFTDRFQPRLGFAGDEVNPDKLRSVAPQVTPSFPLDLGWWKTVRLDQNRTTTSPSVLPEQ